MKQLKQEKSNGAKAIRHTKPSFWQWSTQDSASSGGRRKRYQQKKSRPQIFEIVGGLLVAAGLLWLVFQLLGPGNQSEGNTDHNSAPPGDMLVGRPNGGNAGGAISAQQMRQHVIDTVAKALKLSSEQLDAKLKAGQTLPQIAQEQNVSLEMANAAYIQSSKDLFQDMVKSQGISQEQADQSTKMMENDVAQGRYVLLYDSKIQQPLP